MWDTGQVCVHKLHLVANLTLAVIKNLILYQHSDSLICDFVRLSILPSGGYTFNMDFRQNIKLASASRLVYQSRWHANLVYKHKQSMLPLVFDEYFTHGNEIHNHLNRTSLNLQIKPHNENGKINLKYQIFNKLPKSIVNSHSFHTFKKKVKTHYLEIQNS